MICRKFHLWLRWPTILETLIGQEFVHASSRSRGPGSPDCQISFRDQVLISPKNITREAEGGKSGGYVCCRHARWREVDSTDSMLLYGKSDAV